jgi:hypothetical protein
MFFVFGWGRQTVKTHGPVEVYHCDHCNNDKHWTLYTRRTWFTLFFIPVIPYSTEHLMLCPICNYGVKVENEKFNELRAIAECNSDLINNKITREEHESRINSLSTVNNGGYSEENLNGKTETQLNYIRQMRELEEERNKKSM